MLRELRRDTEECFNGSLREYSHALVGTHAALQAIFIQSNNAFIHQHRGNHGQILCRREYSRITRNTTINNTCRRVVHLAIEQRSVLLHRSRHNGCIGRVGWLGVNAVIPRILELHRLKHLSSSILIKPTSRNLLNNRLQRNKIQAAISHYLTRARQAGCIVSQICNERISQIHRSRIAIFLISAHKRGHVYSSRDTRRVSQQMFYRNILALHSLALLLGFALPRLEVEDITCHIISESHLTVLYKSHKREGSTHTLAQRRQVKHRVRSHSDSIRYPLAALIATRAHLTISVGFQIQYLTHRLIIRRLAYNTQDSTWEIIGRNSIVYHAINLRHTLL